MSQNGGLYAVFENLVWKYIYGKNNDKEIEDLNPKKLNSFLPADPISAMFGRVTGNNKTKYMFHENLQKNPQSSIFFSIQFTLLYYLSLFNNNKFIFFILPQLLHILQNSFYYRIIA